MTRIVFFVLAGMFLLFTCPHKALAGQAIVIFTPGSDLYIARGQSLRMDKGALLINDRLYVPLRYFALGIGVDERSFIWNKDATKVAVLKGNDLLILDMANSAININGKQFTVSPAPLVSGGRTFIPLRSFAETMGYKVVWDDHARNVSVFPGRAEGARQEEPRHSFTAGGFKSDPVESTLEHWHIQLVENNIRLPLESIEKMITQLYIPGETVLFCEKLVGDAIIDLPGDPGQAANNKNANTSLNYINGVILPPGETFSFNSAAGPYTEERGYTTGFAFSGNKVIQSMGGGVCRTSTLVYIAVLNAGLPVVERHRHSLPVDYAPKNKDASVWYGVLDLKFKNDRKYPLVLKSSGNSRRIYLSIWEQHR
ncbi:MAG: VanW family protein [Bacillota bacterium]